MAVPRTAGVPTLLLSQTLAKLDAGAGGQPARLGYRGRMGRKPLPASASCEVAHGAPSGPVASRPTQEDECASIPPRGF